MTVHLVISLLKIPYMHHTYMVLANPMYIVHAYVCWVGQNHTFIGIFGVHTVLLGKSPHTHGHIRCRYTVLANPLRMASTKMPLFCVALARCPVLILQHHFVHMCTQHDKNTREILSKQMVLFTRRAYLFQNHVLVWGREDCVRFKRACRRV
jgi:hypothetical protein